MEIEEQEKYLSEGNECFQKKDFVKALHFYNLSLKLNKFYIYALNNKGIILLIQNQNELALKYFEVAIKINFKYSNAYNGKGIALSRLNKLQESNESFQRALEFQKNNQSALNNLGTNFFYQSLKEKALQYYAKSISFFPTFAIPYNNIGNILQTENQFSEAIDQYNLAIKNDNNYCNAYFNKGNAYFQMGTYSESIKSYDMAIDLNPNFAKAYLHKALALSNLKQYSKAEEFFQLAIQSQSQNIEAYFGLGNIYSTQKKYQESVNQYNIVVQLKPSHLLCQINKANSLVKLKQFQKAIDCYEQAIQINKNYSPSYYNLGTTLIKIGKFSKAYQMLEIYNNMDQNNANGYFYQGFCALKMFKVEAEELLQKAIDLDEYHIFAYFAQLQLIFFKKQISIENELKQLLNLIEDRKATRDINELQLIYINQVIIKIKDLTQQYEKNQNQIVLNEQRISILGEMLDGFFVTQMFGYEEQQEKLDIKQQLLSQQQIEEMNIQIWPKKKQHIEKINYASVFYVTSIFLFKNSLKLFGENQLVLQDNWLNQQFKQIDNETIELLKNVTIDIKRIYRAYSMKLIQQFEKKFKIFQQLLKQSINLQQVSYELMLASIKLAELKEVRELPKLIFNEAKTIKLYIVRSLSILSEKFKNSKLIFYRQLCIEGIFDTLGGQLAMEDIYQLFPFLMFNQTTLIIDLYQNVLMPQNREYDKSGNSNRIKFLPLKLIDGNQISPIFKTIINIWKNFYKFKEL